MSIQKGNIPEGWKLLTEGLIKAGDRKWIDLNKESYFQILVDVEERDIGRPAGFYNVIRKIDVSILHLGQSTH